MIIQISCPHCSGLIDVSDDYSGLKLSCPHCGGGFIVPKAEAASPQVVRTFDVGKWVKASLLIAVIVVCSSVAIIESIRPSPGGGDDPNDAVRPITKQQRQVIESGIQSLEAAGIITDIKVYQNDQAWVYVSDVFHSNTLSDKEAVISAIFKLHREQSRITFISIRNANTGNSIGTYSPNYGLSLD